MRKTVVKNGKVRCRLSWYLDKEEETLHIEEVRVTNSNSLSATIKIIKDASNKLKNSKIKSFLGAGCWDITTFPADKKIEKLLKLAGYDNSTYGDSFFLTF